MKICAFLLTTDVLPYLLPLNVLFMKEVTIRHFPGMAWRLKKEFLKRC